MMINRRRVCGGKKLPQGVVDMGLPSGTLWAQGNIVKDAQGNYAIGEPTDYGCYFSWGNIDGHNEGDGYSFNSANYALTPGSQLTGDIPNNDILHDAAAARIGRGWHLPTLSAFGELNNTTYTKRDWIALDNVWGYYFTSKVNGNTIFFPASGYFDYRIIYKNQGGVYWSNIIINDTNAYSLNIANGTFNQNNQSGRRYGESIRPIITI